jgi:amidophosphoribosyltransferase
VEETAGLIGADSLGYLPVEDAIKLPLRQEKYDPDQCGLCTACFDGTYPTAIPEQGSKNRFEQPIAE